MSHGGNIYEVRSWMYEHKDSAEVFRNKILNRAEIFMYQAGNTPLAQETSKMLCPCRMCKNTKCARSETVWKEKWRYQGDAAKSTFISETTWIGLKAYWNFPRSVRRSYNCSVAQLTSDAEGNLPLPILPKKFHTPGFP